MAFLQSLGKLLNRGANTVNNDVVKPIGRVFNPPNQNPGFNVAPMQKVNLVEGGRPNFGAPTIPTYQGNQIRLDAQKQLGLTPGFVANLINASPYVGKPLPTAGLVNKNASAAEYLGQHTPNQIVLGSPSNPNHALNDKQIAQQNRDTLVHEGLHRIWDTNPQIRRQFAKAYNSGNPPTGYLQSRVAGYTDAQPLMDSGGVYTNDFSNLQSLPPSIQNEIHSYIPQYYSTTVKNAQLFSPNKYQTLQKVGLLPNIPKGQPINMSKPLSNYYSQYYNPVPVHSGILDNLKKLLGHL